jgi:hypothetical protein
MNRLLLLGAVLLLSAGASLGAQNPTARDSARADSIRVAQDSIACRGTTAQIRRCNWAMAKLTRLRVLMTRGATPTPVPPKPAYTIAIVPDPNFGRDTIIQKPATGGVGTHFTVMNATVKDSLGATIPDSAVRWSVSDSSAFGSIHRRPGPIDRAFTLHDPTKNATITVTARYTRGTFTTAATRQIVTRLRPQTPPPPIPPPDTTPTPPPDTTTTPPPVVVPPPVTPPPAGGVAELPRLTVDTRWVAPTRTVLVAAGASLQAALNSATCGDEIAMAQGATWVGRYFLPAKSCTGWIILRTAGTCPVAEGQRMRPSLAGPLARVLTNSGQAAIETSAGAKNWRLVCFEVSHLQPLGITEQYGLVWLGGEHQPSLSAIGSHHIMDRMYVHGQGTQHTRRCVGMNGAYEAVIDSWLSECHADGADAQAIGGWGGPGPYKIVNNYLEGSGENIMFGGVDPAIPNMTPSDITIQRNHIRKPDSWKGGPFSIKNLLETKNARRVLIENNVMEGNWKHAQDGAAVILKAQNQSGSCNWCTSADITMRRNLIRNAGAGIYIDGSGTYVGSWIPSARIDITENWLEGIGAGIYDGDRRYFLIQGDARDIRITKNVALGSSIGSYLALGSTPSATNITMSSNVFQGGVNWTNNFGYGNAAWLGGTAGTRVWSGNVVIGPPNPADSPTGTLFHPTLAAALATGAGVARSVIDAAIAGVVVPP